MHLVWLTKSSLYELKKIQIRKKKSFTHAYQVPVTIEMPVVEQ